MSADPSNAPDRGPGFLARMGLGRADQRAWAMYDWANSAYWTTIVVAVFPPFYNRVAGEGLPEGEATRRLMLATVIAMVIVALTAPVLGAVADFAGQKKRLLAIFAGLGVAASGGMFFLGPGDWLPALALLVAGNVGVAGSIVFYESLLPAVARSDELDLVSSTGYALGYLGGGLLLVLNFCWIQRPDWFGLPSGEGLSPAEATLPARLAFLSVAVWWAVFTLPLLLRVPEPPRQLEPDESSASRVLATAFTRLGETLRELRGSRQAFLVLAAVLLYSEGLGTIIKLAGSYAADLPQITQTDLLSAFVLTQFIGIPCAMLFGKIATWIGTRGAIYITLAVYAFVCVYAAFLEGARDFYVLAVLVGLVQGGAQALGRSLFASVIPAHKAAELFGIYALGSKFAGTLGPATFWLVSTATGKNHLGVLSMLAFFLGGAFVLSRVDVDEGRRVARAAERDLHAAA
jgi:UMF1 family MFS transporter